MAGDYCPLCKHEGWGGCTCTEKDWERVRRRMKKEARNPKWSAVKYKYEPLTREMAINGKRNLLRNCSPVAVELLSAVNGKPMKRVKGKQR